MLNMRNPFHRIVEVKVTADVTAGKETRSGGFVGVPVDHALNGTTVSFALDGIFALTLAIGGTLNAGSYLYWDVAGSALSLGAAAKDVEFGQILGADPDGGSNVKLVRVDVGFPRAAAGNAQA